MRASILRGAIASCAAAGAILVASPARATSALEIGDNGSEQMGRGGAWVARASDPLAVFYNPAGLAGQDTRLTLQGNVNIQSTCFSRIKAQNDQTAGDGVQAGGAYPQVCSNSAPFPDPSLAFTYKVNDRLGLGIAVLGPSAAGNQTWPEKVGTTPAPQRFLLLSANTLLLTPTIGVGWEPIDRWRIGASFLWGIASFDFTNDAYSSNDNQGGNANSQVKADLKVKNVFVPGFTIGTIWSPTDNIDVAGWYKWLDPIVAHGDVTATSTTGGRTTVTDSSQPNCGNPASIVANPGALCGTGQSARVQITVPMEAKIGFRYHMPRAGVDMAHRRDPLSQDVFDLEADLTWANDSALDNLVIRFPGDASGNGLITVPGAGGAIPPNADSPHYFKDVYGARIGGDYNIIADKLAVRAGASFETAAVSAQYLNIDFAGEQRVGIAAGGTYRLRFHDDVRSNALEISVGLGHTFISSLTNPGPTGISANAGLPCPGNASATNGVCTGTTPPTQSYRTAWPINLGTVTNAFTSINLGLSYRF